MLHSYKYVIFVILIAQSYLVTFIYNYVTGGVATALIAGYFTSRKCRQSYRVPSVLLSIVLCILCLDIQKEGDNLPTPSAYLFPLETLCVSRNLFITYLPTLFTLRGRRLASLSIRNRNSLEIHALLLVKSNETQSVRSSLLETTRGRSMVTSYKWEDKALVCDTVIEPTSRGRVTSSESPLWSSNATFWSQYDKSMLLSVSI